MKSGIRKHGRVALAILPCFFLLAAAPLKEKKKPSAPSVPASSSQQARFAEAFAFFAQEEDIAAQRGLAQRVLQEFAEDLGVVTVTAESFVARKARLELHEFMMAIAQRLQCLDMQKAAKSCQSLRKLWNENLDSVQFYEDSAGKLEQARRHIETRKCALAVSLLRELEAREGVLRSVLAMQIDAARCLDNEKSRQVVEQRVNALKFFGG